MAYKKSFDDLPYFYGNETDPEDVFDWIFIIEEFFEDFFEDIPEEKHVEYASYKLKEHALLWWKIMNISQKIST